MVEITVCKDIEIIIALYASVGKNYKDGDLAIRAMAGDECLGFALFEIKGAIETVFAVEPQNDRLLADGLLRSALHVGTERNITEAYYSGDEYEPLYEKINFLEDKSEKKLKLQNLFTDCCNCNKD